jgi:hypothetical protein
MKTFAMGVIFGIVLATIGFSGIARLMDNSMHKLQETAKEASQ